MKFQFRTAKENRPIPIGPDIRPLFPFPETERGKKRKSPRKNFIFILGIGLVLVFFTWGKDFLIYEGDEPKLAPWREEKLNRELEDMDNAEQYVLYAGEQGYYPCFSCYGEPEIFLYPGEHWKYGTTTKKQYGRYPGGLPEQNLVYEVQFRGTLQECLRQEKIKIYHYATLPENLKREKPLMRPPGNKRDY